MRSFQKTGLLLVSAILLVATVTLIGILCAASKWQLSWQEVPRLAVAAIREKGIAGCFVAMAENRKVILYSTSSKLPFESLGTFIRYGQKTVRLTLTQGDHVAPRLSPNEKEVLWHSWQGGTIGIWHKNLPYGSAERICDGAHSEWAPSGKAILLERSGKMFERILSTGEEHEILAQCAGTYLFASYIDTKRVLLVRKTPSGSAVFIADLMNGTAPVCIDSGDISSTPICSPNGKMVAYQRGAHIYLLKLKTKTVEQLTFSPGYQSWPRWSKNSSWIFYAQAPTRSSGVFDICVTNLSDLRSVFVVQKRTSCNFDCNGIVPSHLEKVELPVNFARSFQSKDGKHELANGESSLLMYRKEWGRLLVLVGRARIVLSSNEGSPDRLEISVIDGKTCREAVIDSVCLIENSASGVSFDIYMRSQTDSLIIVRTNLLQIGPTVLFTPVFGKPRLDISLECDQIVIPDRYSSDMLFESKYLAEGEYHVPGTDNILCLYAGGDAVTLGFDREQRAEVSVDERRKYKSISVPSESSRIAISFPRRFFRVIKANEAECQMEESSFPAIWRTPNNANYESRLARTAALRLQDSHRSVICYPIQRIYATPLERITLSDLSFAALGVRQNHTDQFEGSAPPIERSRAQVAIPHAFTMPAIWDPFNSYRFSGELGILELLSGLSASDSAFTYDMVSRLEADMDTILQTLDERIAEYSEFMASVRTVHCVSKVDVRLDSVMANYNGDHVSELLRAFRILDKCITENSGYLYRKPQFHEFADIVREMVTHRQNLILECNKRTLTIRYAAGKSFYYGADAECEWIRREAGDVLKQCLDFEENR